ncbi:(R)-mandelonitrile lyase [Acuticoccus mangrovi]|uniref:Cupin domain-containing protein n=1 Tax=Acuticoccus mangrovi TaxID=2796142 RepID=A0A934IJS1_9HYPH|nr:cupin domain-containing protein [Acuticoccus mangrovi]MBJ3775052.1 cupin domain-containing protein [Acuticoccus mangrovi]
MKLIRCGEVPSKPAPKEHFTGTVWQDPINSAEAPGRAVAVSVTFLPGGRTNWHYHPYGQTLHVLSGAGWFQTEGEARVDIRAGDTVWIPSGEKHWHGATDATMMTHLAMQEREGDATSTWLEPVTDDQYLGKA